MKQKKLTITIGTSAYNEEKNIFYFLKSVFSQKQKTVVLQQVIIASDGSTDNTIKKIKKFKRKEIKIINDGKRLGQPARIAQMLKYNKSDIFVQIDSDMVFQGTQVLETIGRYFRDNKKLQLLLGNLEPLKARTFLESAINNYLIARKELDSEFCFDMTAYGAHAFLAYRKQYAQEITIPTNVLNNDAYNYFYCITRGYHYTFAHDASCYYRSPSTLKDHHNQSVRHLRGGLQLIEYFGKETIEEGFFVPKKILLRLLFLQLKKNPVGYILLKLLNFYATYKSKQNAQLFDPRWTTIATSKIGIL